MPEERSSETRNRVSQKPQSWTVRRVARCQRCGCSTGPSWWTWCCSHRTASRWWLFHPTKKGLASSTIATTSSISKASSPRRNSMQPFLSALGLRHGRIPRNRLLIGRRHLSKWYFTSVYPRLLHSLELYCWRSHLCTRAWYSTILRPFCWLLLSSWSLPSTCILGRRDSQTHLLLTKWLKVNWTTFLSRSISIIRIILPKR